MGYNFLMPSKRFICTSPFLIMDKSMALLMMALAAMVVAGAALIIHGGASDDGGHQPGQPIPVTDPGNGTDPAEPGNPVESKFIIELSKLNLVPGDSAVLTLVSTDETAIGDVRWSLLGNSLRMTDGTSAGKHQFGVTAESAGYCIVAASLDNEVVATRILQVESDLEIPVIPGAVASGPSPLIELNLELSPEEKKTLDVPSDYLKLLTWESTDPSVCSVSASLAEGKVTATGHKQGSCDLVATYGFLSAVCHVVVRNAR